jgi:hypothetical protein
MWLLVQNAHRKVGDKFVKWVQQELQNSDLWLVALIEIGLFSKVQWITKLFMFVKIYIVTQQVNAFIHYCVYVWATKNVLMDVAIDNILCSLIKLFVRYLSPVLLQ